MNRLLYSLRHWLLLAAGLAALGVVLALNAQREHGRIEATERERLQTQSKVIEDNLTRQLTAINLSLESIMAEMPSWRNRVGGEAEGMRHLKTLSAAMPSVRSFLVLDARGTVTLSDLEELVGRDFSQREYFQVPLHSLNPKTLHVSSPFKTVLGNFVITVSRVVFDPHGKFAGVVVAAVDPVDIQVLLSSVRYADDMRSRLVHGDGKVFLIEPALADVLGTDLSASDSFFSRHMKSGAPLSYFNAASVSTGDERLSVLRTIQPPELAMDKALVIAISRNADALFAQWRRDIRSQLLAYALLVLLSVAGLLLWRRLSMQQRLNNQRLKLATAAAGVGIWEFTLATRSYHWDSAMFALFGLDPKTANARNDDWHQLMLPGELERIKAATRAVLKSGQPFDLTFQIRRPDGQLRFMRNQGALHDEGTGRHTRLIGTTADVTERKSRETDMRIAATAFECQEAIIVTDANQLILRVNRAFTELHGYSAEEVLGRTPRLLQSGRHDRSFYLAMSAELERAGAWQGEVWNRRKSGEIFPEWLSITEVRNDEGAVTHYVATQTDITLRKAAEDEIKHLAFYDPLTHLANRRLLHDRLHQAVVQAKRQPQQLALLFVDLDRFKPVNDEFGHKAGDELLQAVAQRLQACVRESDTVARIGGDEFVVLIPGIASSQDAIGVAQKIHAALKQGFTISDGQTFFISSSTGIAIYPEHGQDEAELTAHADAAMYQAKTAGRDRFVLYQAQA